MLIPGDVREVLLEAVVDDDRVVLSPAGDEEACRAARALLEIAGGIGGAEGYAFPGLAAGAVLAALLSDEVPPARAGCDATPPSLAALLLGELGDDLDGLSSSSRRRAGAPSRSRPRNAAPSWTASKWCPNTPGTSSRQAWRAR